MSTFAPTWPGYLSMSFLTAAQAGERLRVLDEWAKRINSDIVVLRSHRSEARPEKALLKTLGDATTAIAAAFSAQGHAGAAPVQIVIRNDFIRGLAANLETVLGGAPGPERSGLREDETRHGSRLGRSPDRTASLAQTERRHQHKFVEVASSAVAPAPLVVYAVDGKHYDSHYDRNLEEFLTLDKGLQQTRARAGPNAKIVLLAVSFGSQSAHRTGSFKLSDGVVLHVVGLAMPPDSSYIGGSQQEANFGKAAASNVAGLRALEKLLE